MKFNRAGISKQGYCQLKTKLSFFLEKEYTSSNYHRVLNDAVNRKCSLRIFYIIPVLLSRNQSYY